MSVIQAPMPNTEKLFLYVKHGHWHNVSASSTRFVKNEYQRCVNDLQVDEKDYENLKLMIDYAEMGKYTEARRIMDSARTQYDKLCGLITGMRQVQKDFQQFDFLTSVDSDEPIQPPFRLKNYKWYSVSRLTFIEYSSD